MNPVLAILKGQPAWLTLKDQDGQDVIVNDKPLQVKLVSGRSVPAQKTMIRESAKLTEEGTEEDKFDRLIAFHASILNEVVVGWSEQYGAFTEKAKKEVFGSFEFQDHFFAQIEAYALSRANFSLK